MNILFDENHSVFAQQVSTQSLSDCQVNIVPSLAAARTCLASGIFDVMSVDHDLNGGKGVEFVRELRDGGNPVRLIGVSAHDDGNDALRNAGVDAICGRMKFDRIRELI